MANACKDAQMRQTGFTKLEQAALLDVDCASQHFDQSVLQRKDEASMGMDSIILSPLVRSFRHVASLNRSLPLSKLVG